MSRNAAATLEDRDMPSPPFLRDNADGLTPPDWRQPTPRRAAPRTPSEPTPRRTPTPGHHQQHPDPSASTPAPISIDTCTHQHRHLHPSASTPRQTQITRTPSATPPTSCHINARIYNKVLTRVLKRAYIS